MAERFDVAVIGGGVIGLSTALELRRAGADKVAVLESNVGVGQGSSTRANGGVRAQFSTPINIAFSLHSLTEFERLHRESKLTSFHQTGYLFCTGSADTERRLRRALELQRSHGVATEWLPADSVVERVPLIRRQGLRGATWHGRDGFLDPHELISTFAAAVRAEKVDLRTSCSVLAIDRSARRLLLTTSTEPVAAEWVVDAAGADAGPVAAMVDVSLPVEPIRRNLAFIQDSGRSRRLIPMCVDVDTGVLVRREVGGGYVVAYSDPHDRPGRDTSLDPRFLEAVAERIGNRFPSLGSMSIDPRQCWAGLYPETPDHHAIIGEAAPGFLVCAGFGGHGLMHAPAAGRAAAEIVTQGACTTFDLHPLRPTRFAEGDLVVETAVL
jgi:sarcosine oxidase, subunit beta